MSNWVTIIGAAIVILSIIFGMRRGFLLESHVLLRLSISLVTALLSVWFGWYASKYLVRFISAHDTQSIPLFLKGIASAWRTHPQADMWITWIVCYFLISKISQSILWYIFQPFFRLIPGKFQQSRLLGAALGGVLGVVRALVAGGVLFLGLQYFSWPVLAKQAAASPLYENADKLVYQPWLKPLVTKQLPVLAQNALEPISQNINLFVVPTGTAGEEEGILLIPKQISELAQKITKGQTTVKGKAFALYQWETTHITYNWQKYDEYVYHDKWEQQSPLQTVETGEGVCADYALLYADFAHSVGLTVKIDEGMGGSGKDLGSHAWNEIWNPVSKHWMYVDTTWGSQQSGWFDTPARFFDQTHFLQTSILIPGANA